jgi:hypothetical protein
MEPSIDEEKFCWEIIQGSSAVQAYNMIFTEMTFGPEIVAKKATALLQTKRIKNRIKELKGQVARNAIFSSGAVVKEWINIASGDANDIVQYQRNNCRYCYGIGGAYHWINANEYAQAVATAIDLKKSLPTDEGGYGYVINRLPVADCKSCFGEGIERVFIRDTRFLTGSAKRLYRGIKQTSHGVEVLLRDQDVALTNLAKYFKVLVDEQVNANSLTIKVVGGLPE